MKIAIRIFRALAAKARAWRFTIHLRVELVSRLSFHHEILVGDGRLGSLSVHVVRVVGLVVLGGQPSSLDPPPGALELGDEREDGDKQDEDEDEQDEDDNELPGEEGV